MSLLTPLAPEEYPGLERLPAYAEYSGTTPNVHTWDVQLPGYGSWLINLMAWYTNRDVAITRAYMVTWFQDARSTPRNLAFATPLGAAAIGTPVSGNGWSDLSAATPSQTGVLVVTGTRTSGGDRNGRLVATGVRTQDATDFLR